MCAINLSEVLKLPVQERIRIVEAIWDSVAEHPEQVELLPWQAEELDRRIAAYQANPTEGIPWEEVKRRILGGEPAERTGRRLLRARLAGHVICY